MITDDGEGRYTYTPDGFRECFVAYDDGYDCWYTGADLRIVYVAVGLDGEQEYLTCKTHRDDALADLADPRRAPYITKIVREEALS